LESGQRILDIPVGDCLCDIAWDPGSHWIATTRDNRRIVFHSIPDGAVIYDYPVSIQPHQLAVRPDAGAVAVSEYGGNKVLIVDPTSGEEIAERHNPNAVHDCAWSADGCKLAIGAADGMVHIWDMQSSLPAVVLTGHSSAVGHLHFSPNGQLLSPSSWDSSTRLWDAILGVSLI
jgi:WD40 repeat protein